MFGRNNQSDNLFSDKSPETEKETAKQPEPAKPQPQQQPQARPQMNRPQTSRPESGAGVMPNAPARPVSATNPENKILTVGRDITLSGEIKQCDRLIIEGEVDATLEGTRVLEISQAGTFRGDTEVEEADIAGLYSGTLTARRKLIIRKTGRVTGNIRYKEVIVEAGGKLGGDVSFMDED